MKLKLYVACASRVHKSVRSTIFGWLSVRPFINNLYWNFNGFDQASHYSTTVPKKTLRNGIAGSLVLVSSAYLIPILVITGATNIEQNQWNAGSFATAGTEIGGRWLGNWIVFSSGVSLLAQFFSEMAADSMGVQGLADRGHIPSIFRHQSPHNTPTVRMIEGLSTLILSYYVCVLTLSSVHIVQSTQCSSAL